LLTAEFHLCYFWDKLHIWNSIMELIGLPDATRLVDVSITTLRNYIRDKRLTAYEKGGRIMVERSEVLAVFGPKRLTPAEVGGQARVISIANQKGGVGKTSTAVALATILARETPVLAIDCDPQGNMTQAFGFDPDQIERTLYNGLVQDLPLTETFLRVGPPPANLTLVPANLDLADTWRRVAGRVGLESLLKTGLEPLLPRFGFVILDCPPSLDDMTINALVAATEVIVPVDMSVFSVRGMVKLMGTMQEVRKVNPRLPPPRIVACRTEHTIVSQSIEEGLRAKFGGSVFRAAIPRGKDIAAAHAARRPLPLHAPKSKATLAYEALADEVRHV
jgi:chromosome partitioning protein